MLLSTTYTPIFQTRFASLCLVIMFSICCALNFSLNWALQSNHFGSLLIRRGCLGVRGTTFGISAQHLILSRRFAPAAKRQSNGPEVAPSDTIHSKWAPEGGHELKSHSKFTQKTLENFSPTHMTNFDHTYIFNHNGPMGHTNLITL
jgi:hypothetical protein